MKVMATQKGFYKRLHKPGDTFEVPKDMFSETWMEAVKKPNKAVPKTVEVADKSISEEAEKVSD